MEHFLHVPLRHLINAKPPFMSWWRSAFNEVNDWAPETKETCQFCENDCTTTSYSYSIYATKIDASTLCSPNNPTESISKFGQALLYGTEDDEFYEMPPKFIRNFEEIVHGKSNDAMHVCIERVNHLAIVNFQIDTQTVTQIQRTERVTFANTVSNIGRWNK